MERRWSLSSRSHQQASSERFDVLDTIDNVSQQILNTRLRLDQQTRHAPKCPPYILVVDIMS